MRKTWQDFDLTYMIAARIEIHQPPARIASLPAIHVGHPQNLRRQRISGAIALRGMHSILAHGACLALTFDTSRDAVSHEDRRHESRTGRHMAIRLINGLVFQLLRQISAQ